MQITRFSIHQTSKIIGLAYFCFTLIFVPMFLGFVFSDAPGSSKWYFLAAPFAYGVAAYVFTAFACMIYNWLAKRFGGIEFSTSGGEPERPISVERPDV